jgi:NAD(P) transhydrogenase subunit alpha
LGAVVRAFDTRPAVKEQVQSMGAEFLELTFEEDGSGEGGYAKVMSPAFIAAEMALFAQQATEVDIIITTALIPGKAAPRLVTEEMVNAMKPGSVIVDMAAEQGGNCELTHPGEVYDHNGVKIVGLTDLASRMANQASQLYGNNLVHLLSDLGGAENYTLDMEDTVVRQSTVVLAGDVTWPAPPLERPAPPKAATPETPAAKGRPRPRNRVSFSS